MQKRDELIDDDRRPNDRLQKSHYTLAKIACMAYPIYRRTDKSKTIDCRMVVFDHDHRISIYAYEVISRLKLEQLDPGNRIFDDVSDPLGAGRRELGAQYPAIERPLSRGRICGKAFFCPFVFCERGP